MNRTIRAISHLLLTLGAMLAAGCLPPDDVGVSLVGGPEWTFEAASAELAVAAGASRDRIDLSGAINETLAVRVVATARGEPISRPTLRVEPASGGAGAIEPAWCRIYRMRRVKPGPPPGWVIRSVPPDLRVTEPYDALIPISAPRGGMPASLLTDQEYHFWLDVHIPKGTDAGQYAGSLVLGGGALDSQLELTLTVHPFVLPDQPGVMMIAPVDHRALALHHLGIDASGVEALWSAAGHGGPAHSESDGRGRPFHSDREPGGHQDPALLESAGRVGRLFATTMQMLRAHGLTPVLEDLRPRARIDSAGRLEIDWTDYDRLVAPLLDGRALPHRTPLPVWPMPVRAFVASLGDAGADEYVGAYVAQCVRHFAARGWLDRAYVPAPDPWPITSESVRRVERFARLVSVVERAPAVAVPLGPQDMQPLGWVDYPRPDFGDRVGIWSPPAQFYDPPSMRAERAADRRTWVAVDRPPYSGSAELFARPGDTLALSWCVRHLEAEAGRLPPVNRWPRSSSTPTAQRQAPPAGERATPTVGLAGERPSPPAPDPDACARADSAALLYPGTPFGLDEPIPSVRLKRLRRSMQDAAYVELLTRQGLEHITEALGAALVTRAAAQAYRTHFADGRPAGWPDDPGRFDAARRIMIHALLRRVHDSTGAGRTPRVTANVDWRRFMLGMRTLDLSVEGVRVRGARAAERGGLIVDCTVNVMNHMRTPLSGTLDFASLPPGWNLREEPVRIDNLSPGSSRRLILSAAARGVTTDAAGVMPLDIELTTDDGGRFGVAARLSHAVAARTGDPPRIDGSLDDWPVGIGNAMGDFVLITGTPQSVHQPHRSRPRSATIAFVLRDDRFLYLGINCLSTGDPQSALPAANTVTYEDLVPVGDELVEVLIDPLGAGTRSPTDLYHVAIKPSGADLAERGIGLSPPCGRRSPWAADVRSATRVGPGGWTAELRIPIASFEAAHTENTVWGINVTRFDAAHQEFSTWSGAVGNAYDPLSLGNLYWP